MLQIFRLDLRLGPVSATWKARLPDAVDRLQQDARSAGDGGLLHALAELRECVRTWCDESQVMSGEMHQALLVACAHVRDASGEALLDDVALERCEALILEAHLGSIDEVTPLVQKRLRDARLTSCSALSDLSSGELSRRAAIETSIAERVLSAVADLIERRSPELQRLSSEAPEHVLTRLVDQLGRLDQQYRAACSSDDASLKRRLRRQRQHELNNLELTLAKLGEARMLGSLERRAVADKVSALRQWLSQH